MRIITVLIFLLLFWNPSVFAESEKQKLIASITNNVEVFAKVHEYNGFYTYKNSSKIKFYNDGSLLQIEEGQDNLGAFLSIHKAQLKDFDSSKVDYSCPDTTYCRVYVWCKDSQRGCAKYRDGKKVGYSEDHGAISIDFANTIPAQEVTDDFKKLLVLFE